MKYPRIRFVDKEPEKARFYSTLKKRVETYFEEHNLSKNFNSIMVIKSTVLLSCYIVPFVLVLAYIPPMGINLLLWALMGFSLAGIGMSIMHDANHGAYSTNKTLNYLMGHTLNLLGGSVFNWKIQHNLLHHTYTNIVNMDDDIDDKAIMRFSPHTELKWYNKFQFLYSFFFYGLTTIYWVLLKDYVQFIRYTKHKVNKNTTGQNYGTIFRMVFIKLLYFLTMLFVPVYFFNVPVLSVVMGFLLMHFIAGIVLTVVFQLAHTVEGTSHPLPDEKGNIENNWAIHQMNTTINFSRKSKFISWYVGGLNFQVEHHLFPTICHVHYPQISEIVKSTAEEFGVPYLENTTFIDALKSHVRTLKRFGRLPDLNAAIG